MRRIEELHQLHPDALARQPLQAVARRDRGAEPGRIGQPFAVDRVEAEEAQDAQIVLGDARAPDRR